MNKLSKLQKEYLTTGKLTVGKTHYYNVIAAIRKKITDFDYFLIEFFKYPFSIKFEEYLEKIRATLDERLAKEPFVECFCSECGNRYKVESTDDFCSNCGHHPDQSEALKLLDFMKRDTNEQEEIGEK